MFFLTHYHQSSKVEIILGTYYNVSGGPIISTSHLYMSLSSIRPAEKPSTGFLFNSETKTKRYFWILHLNQGQRGIYCYSDTTKVKDNLAYFLVISQWN